MVVVTAVLPWTAEGAAAPSSARQFNRRRDIAAENWRGWHGAKTQESLEGHLRLSCTSDGLGHVTVRVYLRGDMTGADWRVEGSVYLEAGQLDEIARAARENFSRALPNKAASPWL